MTIITTETSQYLTKEIRELVKKEGLNGVNVSKRCIQLRRQGYSVNMVGNNIKGWNWRVYEVE